MTQTNPVPIYQENDFYVPYFEIFLRKRKVDKAIVNDIISLTYRDNLTDMDSFDMTVNNWDPAKRNFKYIEREDIQTFYPGQDIEILMGYYYQGKKKIQRMLYGEITTLEPNFPNSGYPTLSVRGLNILHSLRDKQRSDGYVGKSYRKIVKKIEQRSTKIKFEKLPPDSVLDEDSEMIFQNNTYDILFLMELARSIGYEIYVDLDDKEKNGKFKLYFRPSDTGEKKYLLEWGKSLISFRPTLTTINQVSKVVVIGWSPQKKQRVKGEATRKDLKTTPIALGVKDKVKIIENSFNQKFEIIAKEPIRNSKAAKKMAKATLEKITKGMVKASGSTFGIPDLRAGTYMDITNLGNLFSGRYYITQTTHTINESGYQTNFSARKEEKNK